MTRVLIAFDTSEQAYRALALAESLAWPTGSEIRVVSVIPSATDFMVNANPWMMMSEPSFDVSQIMTQGAEASLLIAAARLERPGIKVNHAILAGHPSEAICRDAASFDAQLIIVGSRGHGALANAVLGSVSAAVVDHAPCPVLVARTSAVRHILLGVDGSTASRLACELASSSLFGGATLTAAAVADTRWPWWSGLPEAAGVPNLPAQEALAEERRANAKAAAAHELEALTAQGCVGETALLEGDPAAALIAEALRRGVDMVALGSRGQTGVRRLVLGSVARNVLLHASCSVLIAHAPR